MSSTSTRPSILGFKLFALLVVSMLIHLGGAIPSSDMSAVVSSSSSGPLVARGFETLKSLSKRSGENQPIVPACITGCIARNAVATWCATDDAQCICTIPSWVQDVGSCFAKACGNDSAGIAVGVAYTEAYCMTADVLVTISVPSS
ncbi:BZ3500_MvSof-1268-A1-R1_Chr4-3g07309 [Microbotryum saponariae]|uniref:BZ3500_MvSof-1268-A1-R1_Chr4-3g07309 protein n=1 Tax=Microbotryum saponariae TaxID=289078 RepID=A0A2X0NGT2_9BASI|nr:BZ3500_MvSof-1268-A1-R1_Chr4-3g07309 [Microbotryum saponariae]SDA06972.1 BZ3501_MvSof-1269-A2-R1_Chr4-2g07018 [Microbotryum saponariae]